MDAGLVAQLSAASQVVTNLNAERARWAAMTSSIYISPMMYPSDMMRIGCGHRLFDGKQVAVILKAVLAQIDADLVTANAAVAALMTTLTAPAPKK